MVYYFSSEKHDAHIDFSKKLSSFLNSADAFSHPIAVMCIGSDRSTGDSLGPLIGYKLSKFAFNNVFIYGSLNNPINAVNLEFAITFIKNFHSNPYIIAIDASLGRNDHVGCITLAEGPLRPGLGVKKRAAQSRKSPYHRHCKCCRFKRESPSSDNSSFNCYDTGGCYNRRIC